MFIVKHRKIFFLISAILMMGSLFAFFSYGFNLGTDFRGGSILEVSFANERPTVESLNPELSKLDLGAYTLTPAGDRNFILKSRELTQADKENVLAVLSQGSALEIKEERFSSVGPTVGKELRTKATVAISVVSLCIVLFIAFAFRKVSKPVSSWKYGLATLIALAHDVAIPTGVFAVWSSFTGAEVDLLFVTALLAILGYSVHDTIVVFDRVRENLSHSGDAAKDFIGTVGKSVNQTMARSINTSVTTFLALVSLYVFGGDATKNFAFILLVGIVVGTYSSIFVASPLLVTLERFGKK
ncbi:MAG: protein translocase subunit SecF [Patescibacteria group bacterium]